MNENLFIISESGDYIRIGDISVFMLGVNTPMMQDLRVSIKNGDTLTVKTYIMYEDAEAYTKQIIRALNHNEPPVNTLPKGILADFRRKSYPFGDNPNELKSMF